MTASNTLQPSQIFARSQGSCCEGQYECHYCSAPCDDFWVHEEPPPVPFVRGEQTAKRPNCPWLCVGCWLWRRKRVTVPFLSGGYADIQQVRKHSWVVTEEAALAIALKPDFPALLKLLLSPPRRFFLSLIDGTAENLLQLCVLNDFAGDVRADAEILFTLNNVVHSYTPYDLRTALENKNAGRSPGVAAILRKTTPPPGDRLDLSDVLRPTPQLQPPKRGRPPGKSGDQPKPNDVVRRSGR